MHYRTTTVKPFAPGVNYGDAPYSSNFWVRAWNPMVWPFKWHLFSSTDFHMVLFNMQQVVLVTFDKILQELPLKWSLLRTFLRCFPFSIHKFSKLILRLYRGGNCGRKTVCLAVWEYYTGKQDKLTNSNTILKSAIIEQIGWKLAQRRVHTVLDLQTNWADTKYHKTFKQRLGQTSTGENKQNNNKHLWVLHKLILLTEFHKTPKRRNF